MLRNKVKRCVLSGTGRHTRAGQAHARKDARGGDTLELHEGDEPWAALMIPHSGGDTQRDNRLIKPHTHGEYRETYQRGETDNVGIHAVRTKVLH